MSLAGLTCNPSRFSYRTFPSACPSSACSLALSSLCQEKLKGKMRFLPSTNRKHWFIPIRRCLIMKTSRIKNVIYAAFGDMADNSSDVFPRIHIKDPYKRLGISREASEEEIQAARNFLISKYSGNKPSVDAIESAHDKIIMQSFYDRKNPKINIKKKVREITQSRYVKAVTSRFQTPAMSIVLKTSITFLVLGVLTFISHRRRAYTSSSHFSYIIHIFHIWQAKKPNAIMLIWDWGFLGIMAVGYLFNGFCDATCTKRSKKLGSDHFINKLCVPMAIFYLS